MDPAGGRDNSYQAGAHSGPQAVAGQDRAITSPWPFFCLANRRPIGRIEFIYMCPLPAAGWKLAAAAAQRGGKTGGVNVENEKIDTQKIECRMSKAK